MKKRMTLTVRGRTREHEFTVEGYTELLQEYWDDGLDIHILHNVIPQWLPIGMTKVWCAIENWWRRQE